MMRHKQIFPFGVENRVLAYWKRVREEISPAVLFWRDCLEFARGNERPEDLPGNKVLSSSGHSQIRSLGIQIKMYNLVCENHRAAVF